MAHAMIHYDNIEASVTMHTSAFDLPWARSLTETNPETQSVLISKLHANDIIGRARGLHNIEVIRVQAHGLFSTRDRHMRFTGQDMQLCDTLRTLHWTEMVIITHAMITL